MRQPPDVPREQFDEQLAQMQSPGAAAAMQRAFDMTPAELGGAAVRAAQPNRSSPALSDQHRLALREALVWLPSVVPPVAIVVAGSIIRGNPGPASDLDIVVLHDTPWRRRVQRWFNATPTEIFFNSEAWLIHAIEAESAEGRPVMAHMLATGHLLMDTAGRMQALQARAAALLARGPNLTADALLRDRYAAATLVEDALDVAHAKSADAKRLRALAVEALLRHAYLKANQFLPRSKERLSVLAERDPILADLLCAALSAPEPAPLRNAALQILGTAGFFEWDSGPGTTPPPT